MYTTNCKSCRQHGHSSARSPLCPDHQPTKKELLKAAFPQAYKQFMVSITLGSFLRIDGQGDRLERFQEKVIERSTFLRQIIYRAQIFVNS